MYISLRMNSCLESFTVVVFSRKIFRWSLTFGAMYSIFPYRMVAIENSNAVKTRLKPLKKQSYRLQMVVNRRQDAIENPFPYKT